MQQLNEHDAAFLYSDTAHGNSNVTLVHIYDQSTAPGGVVRFKQILTHVAQRLERVPALRQRVLRMPWDLDYPYWVDDEHFNLEYHVRHIALPKPGDWRQFCIQASRIHARALDRNRPLWEMYVIEGLDSFLDLPVGSFAVLIKVHHAAIELSHGHELTRLLHDLQPRPAPAAPPAPWFPEPEPGSTELLLRAGMHLVLFPFRMAQPLRQRWMAVKATLGAFADELSGRTHAFPMTRFNTEVSEQRVFDTRRFSLQDFRAIRALVPGATVNDVVLAVCAGALRRYLLKEEELPPASLVAAVPIAVHGHETLATPGHAALSWLRAALATDEPDPVRRLAAIHAATAQSTTQANAIGARELAQLAEQVPSLALAATSKMLRSASAMLGDWAPLANCAITHVPGSKAPLYLQGARLTYLSAILPVNDGMGLVFAATGYNDTMVISFTACAEQLPDPQGLALALRDSFQEYLALVAEASAPEAAPRRRKSRRVGAVA